MKRRLGSVALPRREFLSTLTAGAGLSLGLPALARAGANARTAIRFVVVTDTHLGHKDQDSAEKLWSRTAAEIADLDAEFVLHLGDLVDRGQEPLYPKYVEARKQIKSPVHEIPGNHDPQELFEKYIRQPVDTAVDHQWLRLLLVNNSHTDSHDGFLTGEQLAWIDNQLADATRRDLLSILCMHVPAHTNKHPDRGWYVKPESGQKELYATLKEHSERVLALFHGHFHNGLRGWDDAAPVHEICFPSALYNQDRKLEEQKAPGYNLDEFRPAWCVVTLEGGQLNVQLRAIGAGDAAAKSLRTLAG